MNNIFENVDSLSSLSLLLNSVLVFTVGYLYKQINIQKKDFDDRLERKENKLDEIIRDTNNDFKRIIEDGQKDKSEIKFILDKYNDLLKEVKLILQKR
jgi:patatin-like phospholipase/acyl hydrolase